MMDPLYELSQMRKTPPVAKLLGSAIGLLLGAAAGNAGAGAGQLPAHAPWLERIGQDPNGCFAALESLEPDGVPNAAVHSLMDLLHRMPELSAPELEALARSPEGPPFEGGRNVEKGQAWRAPLGKLGLALLGAAGRCARNKGRMPMDPSTVLVCVDGSRLSYLALEVAASLRKHGRLVVLHVDEDCAPKEQSVLEPPVPETGGGGSRPGSSSGGEMAEHAQAGGGGLEQLAKASANERKKEDKKKGSPPDLGVEFLETDLQERCKTMLRVAPHRLKVLVDSRGLGVSEAVYRVAEAERADLVVLGCFGAAKGARIGSLGDNALWAAKAIKEATVVLATPYSSPMPPLREGGVDAPRHAVFMVVLRAERPLNTGAVFATMRLMSHWHSLLIYVVLNEAQTKAEATGQAAQPPIQPVVQDLEAILRNAQLTSSASGDGDEGSTVNTVGTVSNSGDGPGAGRSCVKVEPFSATKTREQLVVRTCDAERVDFLALDRGDDHLGIARSARASIILLPL